VGRARRVTATARGETYELDGIFGIRPKGRKLSEEEIRRREEEDAKDPDLVTIREFLETEGARTRQILLERERHPLFSELDDLLDPNGSHAR